MSAPGTEEHSGSATPPQRISERFSLFFMFICTKWAGQTPMVWKKEIDGALERSWDCSSEADLLQHSCGLFCMDIKPLLFRY